MVLDAFLPPLIPNVKAEGVLELGFVEFRAILVKGEPHFVLIKVFLRLALLQTPSKLG